MTKSFTRKYVTIAAVALLGCVLSVWAGNLTPPPGPVTATMKPLDQIEPRTALNATNTPGDANNVFVITQPGSYYLTGQLNVPAGKNGIMLGTWNVTIDLNGFAIHGLPGSLDGVTWNNALAMITIKNGVVDTCGGDGIDLTNAWGSLISHVTFIDNGGNGLMVYASMVDDCIAHANGQAGFVSRGIYTTTGGTCSFTRCTAMSNNTGFWGAYGDQFEHCASLGNVAVGFQVGSFATVEHCTAFDNTLQGIVCADECTIANNKCRHNGPINYAGIWAQGNRNRIDGNDVQENGFGVYVSGTNNIIVRNTAGQSSNSNFYVVAGNHLGLIVQPSMTTTTVSGNSGGGMGTTDPNANFVY